MSENPNLSYYPASQASIFSLRKSQFTSVSFLIFPTIWKKKFEDILDSEYKKTPTVFPKLESTI